MLAGYQMHLTKSVDSRELIVTVASLAAGPNERFEPAVGPCPIDGRSISASRTPARPPAQRSSAASPTGSVRRPGRWAGRYACDAYSEALSPSKVGGSPLWLQRPQAPRGGPWKLLAQVDIDHVPCWAPFEGWLYAFVAADGSKARMLYQIT